MLLDQLVLAAWCGLVAGLLEVGTIVLRKELFDPNQLYGMSRHFVWLIPLTNLGLFLVLGCLRRGRLPWPGRAAVAGCCRGSLCARSCFPWS